MAIDWLAELTSAVVRQFGVARTAELAGNLAATADAIAMLPALPIDVADQPPDQPVLTVVASLTAGAES
ncbi:MAG: hypothetical protein NTZ05_06095 [Chloroflexi bacterium]|nr:hypothetical protein [Chloroflexota bacterium]